MEIFEISNNYVMITYGYLSNTATKKMASNPLAESEAILYSLLMELP